MTTLFEASAFIYEVEIYDQFYFASSLTLDIEQKCLCCYDDVGFYTYYERDTEYCLTFNSTATGGEFEVP